MALVGTALAEEHHTPELLAQFRRTSSSRAGRCCAAASSGRGRGELAHDGPETAVNALVGSYYASYLAGSRVPRNWPERAVELVTARTVI